MKTLLAMTCLVLALWLLSHFYFCYYSIYYKTHVATTAIVEGVISFSYVRSPVLSPLMADSGIMMFEGNEGILPTIFPAFKITGLAPGLNLEDGLRIGIPFWLLFRNYSGQESEENTCTMNIMVLADLREAKTPDKRAAYRAGEERSRNFCGTVPQALGSRRST